MEPGPRKPFLAFSFLLALASALLSALAVAVLESRSNDFLVRYNYIVWLVVLLGAYSAWLKIRYYWNKISIYSSLLLSLLSLIGLTTSLIGPELYVLFSQNFTQPLIGMRLYGKTLEFSMLVIPFSFINLIVSFLELVFKGPLVFSRGPTFESVFSRAWRQLLSLVSKPFHVLILAFVSGFIIRLYPELRFWPWLVGWDTPEYVAHLLDFLSRLNPFTAYYWMGVLRHIPPLLDLVLVLPAKVLGAWIVFKIYPPFAYGLLTTVMVYFIGKYSGDWRRALVAGVASSLMMATLKVGYNPHRQHLGSILLLLSIASLEFGIARPIVTLLLIVMTALSHEITAYIAIALSLAWLWSSHREGRSRLVAYALVALTASIILEIWYWNKPVNFNKVLGAAPPGLMPYKNFADVASRAISGFILVAGPLIILASVELRRGSLRYLKTASASILIAALTPIIMPFTAVPAWNRFLVEISPILSPLAIYVLLRHIEDRRLAGIILLFALIFPGLLFLTGSPLTKCYVESLGFKESGYTSESSWLVNDAFNASKIAIESSFGNTPIIADANVERYLHILYRNPTPSDIIYAANWNPEQYWEAVEKINSSQVIVITVYNLESYLPKGINVTIIPFKDYGNFKVYAIIKEKKLREN